MKKHPDISFHFIKQFHLSHRLILKGFIADIFKDEEKTFDSLAYIFCSDEYLLEINRNFLSHDYYTDIISFDLSETQTIITGEIYISVDRVRDNARRFNTSLRKELARVMFHGALHLCGYRDKTTREKAVMNKKENQYLASFLKRLQ